MYSKVCSRHPAPRLLAPAGASYLYNAFNVAVSLREVHSTQACGALTVFHVRTKHRTGAFPLTSDHTAHGGESGNGSHSESKNNRSLPAPKAESNSIPPSWSWMSGPGRMTDHRVVNRGGWRWISSNPQRTKHNLPAGKQGRKRKYTAQSSLIFRGGAMTPPLP